MWPITVALGFLLLWRRSVQLLRNRPQFISQHLLLFIRRLYELMRCHTKCFSHLQAGKRVGKALHAPLMKLLEQEESLGKKQQKVGFFG